MAENVETAVYRLRVEGQDQIDRMTKSIEGLAVAEEDATKATRTTSDELQRRLARYDPLIRAQQAYSKELQNIARYQETGVGTQQEINALFEGATARYQAATKATEQLGEAHKGLNAQGQAAFHSMRSMVEMLAMGMSPIQALTSQMNHLSFAASGEGGIAGAFKQASGMIGSMIETAKGFLSPANLVIGTIVAMGAAIVTAAVKFASAQKEIERSLIGIGGQSGATIAKINAFAQIGPQQSLTGMSIGEKREAGTTFAQAGVDVGKLKGVEDAIRGYAIVAGTDATKATEALAKALGGDLVKAVDDLEKVYGALDPKLSDTVHAMLLLNDKAGAQQAIMDAVAAANKRALDTITPLSAAWSGLINIAQMVGEGWLKILSYRVFETPGQRAAAAAKEAAAAAAAAQQQANQIQNKGQAAIESVEPQIAQIRKLELALADLLKAKEAVGGPIPSIVDPGAEQILRNSIQALQDTKSNAEAYAQTVARVSAEWQGVSQSAAMALHAQEAQLPVIEAIGGQAKALAQYQLDYYATWDKTHNVIEAVAVAMENFKITQATANAQAKETLWNLQNQAAAAAAVTDEQKRSTEAEATKNKLIHDNVDATLAQQVANQQLANAEASAAAAAKRSSDNLHASRQQDLNYAGEIERHQGQTEKSMTSMVDSSGNIDFNMSNLAANIAAGANSAERMSDSFTKIKNTIPGSGGWNASFAGGAFDVPGSGPGGGKTGVSVTTLDPVTMSLFQNPMQAPSYSDLVNQAMLGGTGSALAFAMGQQAHGQIAQTVPGFGGTPMEITGGIAAQAVTESDIISQVQSLFQLQQSQTQDKAVQGQSMQAELAWLQSRPQSLEQQRAIVSLKQSIEQLTKSTDSLNATNQDLLSPYYTQDPRTSHIGFRSQGMALGGYVDVPGGTSSNDNMIATIPVASGERIYIDPMTNRRAGGGGSGGSNSVVINSPIHIYGNVDKDQFGRTLYQSNQALAKQIATVR